MRVAFPFRLIRGIAVHSIADIAALRLLAREAKAGRLRLHFDETPRRILETTLGVE